MKAEPRKDAHEAGARSEDGQAQVLLRRRRADWRDDARRSPELGGDARRAAVQVAAATLAAYDGQTGGHSDDVVTICEALAERLQLDEDSRSHLLAAAQLHDIGKVALPSAILSKPAPLDLHEWDSVREHTLRGEHILSAAPELREVGRIVRHSHERWDGRGYPDGLAGEEIPLESRIVFCADAFHAIRCDRPYRAGRSAVEALEEVQRGSGTQFDPVVVQALAATATELREAPTSRLEALTTSIGSRRLLVLLLALTVGGSAVAAPWSPFGGLLGTGDGRAEAVTCDGPCVPAPLGDIGRLPDGEAAADAGIRGAELGRARGAGADEPGSGRRPTGEDRRGSGNGSPAGDSDPGSSGGNRGGARGGGGGSGPAGQAPSGGGGATGGGGANGGKGVAQAPGQQKPVSPGRSGEAPGKPTTPGGFGPGGRSGEAPGKPTGPGKFGQGNKTN